MPDCPTCGSYIPDHTSVCPDCGMDLHSPPPSAPVAPAMAPPPPAPAVASPARLVVKRHGALTAEHFPLHAGEHIVVGRFDPDSGPVDIDLGPLPEAVYVSRHHAEFWHDATGQWMLRDLGSGNGTFVRSQGQGTFQRLSGEQAVHDGDEIALGNARFVLRLG